VSFEDVVLPRVDDPDTGGFWDATRHHELAVRACNDCGQVLHLPKSYCHTCGSWETSWRVVSPLGTLYAWTTVMRQFHRAFTAPYTLVLVELDDAPLARLIGCLQGAPELAPGMRMSADFVDVAGISIPVWHPLVESEMIVAGGVDT